MAQTTYWQTRGRQFKASRWRSALKRNVVSRALLSRCLSVRLAASAFTAKALSDCGTARVLDLGAGAGQDVVASAGHAIGVDIPGAPAETALRRGYKEYYHYDAGGKFYLDRPVDVILCQNLNAHIDFNLFEELLSEALAYLRPGGRVILINEYDNDGISYRLMKWFDRSRWQRLVAGMDHEFFETEDRFVEKLRSSELGLTFIHRQALIGGFLPALHYLAYFRLMVRPSKTRGILTLVLDIPLSLLNWGHTLMNPPPGTAYLVGHILAKQ